MPAVSPRQQRYLYERFGAAWVKRHHFDHVDPLAAAIRSRTSKRHHHKQTKG